MTAISMTEAAVIVVGSGPALRRPPTPSNAFLGSERAMMVGVTAIRKRPHIVVFRKSTTSPRLPIALEPSRSTRNTSVSLNAHASEYVTPGDRGTDNTHTTTSDVIHLLGPVNRSLR